ncbi:MAG TPA: carboxypeptidase-like regulatory domain-containing protein, partial [Kofleriaceae bacterium]
MRTLWVGGTVVAIFIAAIWCSLGSTPQRSVSARGRDAQTPEPITVTPPRPTLGPTLAADEPPEHRLGLHGFVVDSASRPIAGATLTAERFLESPLPAVVSDVNGEFFIPSAKQSYLSVRTSAPGYGSTHAAYDLVDDVTIVLAAEATLHGRVIDARTHTPIAGARISASPGALTTVSDAEGAFDLVGLEPGDIGVIARGAHAYGELKTIILAGQHGEVIVQTARVPEVTARFVMENGSPCVSGTLQVSTHDGGSSVGHPIDIAGIASVPLMPGSYEMHGICRDGLALEQKPVEIVVDREDVELVRHFETGETLVGRVTD